MIAESRFADICSF